MLEYRANNIKGIHTRKSDNQLGITTPALGTGEIHKQCDIVAGILFQAPCAGKGDKGRGLYTEAS